MSATAPTTHDLSARPTRVRYRVLLYLCLLAFILYLDRICISQAGPAIRDELGLSEKQLGYVFASFTIAYGLFMAAAGRLGDRFGSRGVLVAIVIWWSAFTAITGACTGFIMLIAVRFIFGAGEAGAFPNCARIIGRWFAPDARGFPQGLLNTAALIGGAMAPFAVAWTMSILDKRLGPFFMENFGSAPIGWRWTFLLFGLLGLVWAFFFWKDYRDDPNTDSRVNEAERALIRRGRAITTLAQDQEPLPWSRVLSSRNIWLMGFIITCASFVSYLYFSWLPTYLQSARGVSKETSGGYASRILAGGALGSLCGGFLGDWVLRQTKKWQRSPRRSMGRRRGAKFARWRRQAHQLARNPASGVGWKRSRALIGSFAMSTAGLALLASLSCEDASTATNVIAIAFFLMMLQISSWWSVVGDISGKFNATLFGLMNSMGVVGGAGAQIFFGYMADVKKAQGLSGRAQWDPALYYFVTVLFIGAAAWLFVNPNKSAVEAEKKPATLE